MVLVVFQKLKGEFIHRSVGLFVQRSHLLEPDLSIQVRSLFDAKAIGRDVLQAQVNGTAEIVFPGAKRGIGNRRDEVKGNVGKADPPGVSDSFPDTCDAVTTPQEVEFLLKERLSANGETRGAGLVELGQARPVHLPRIALHGEFPGVWATASKMLYQIHENRRRQAAWASAPHVHGRHGSKTLILREFLLERIYQLQHQGCIRRY